MLRNTRIRSIYRLPGNLDAPARARQIALRELADAPSTEVVEDAELLLSEITAERIGAPGPSDPRRRPSSEPQITIDVRKSPTQHRWMVIDRGTPTLPGGLRSTALDKIARAWGVTRRSGLTRTWFEIDPKSRPPRAPRSPR